MLHTELLPHAVTHSRTVQKQTSQIRNSLHRLSGLCHRKHTGFLQTVMQNSRFPDAWLRGLPQPYALPLLLPCVLLPLYWQLPLLLLLPVSSVRSPQPLLSLPDILPHQKLSCLPEHLQERKWNPFRLRNLPQWKVPPPRYLSQYLHLYQQKLYTEQIRRSQHS